MKAKTISELVQLATSALRECLFSARIAPPMRHAAVARSRRRARGAPGPYRSKLRAGLCASKASRAWHDAGLRCLATCSCFLTMQYLTGWVDRIQSTRIESRD